MSEILSTMIKSALSAFDGIQKTTSFGAVRVRDSHVQVSFEFRGKRLVVIEVDPAEIVDSIIVAMAEKNAASVVVCQPGVPV